MNHLYKYNLKASLPESSVKHIVIENECNLPLEFSNGNTDKP